MFNDAENFISDISGWNVENVKNISSSFEGAKNFSSNLELCKKC